jgi:hypothetical protein
MGQSLFTDASLGMEQCGLAESAAQLPSCVNGGDHLDGCTAAWHDAQH